MSLKFLVLKNNNFDFQHTYPFLFFEIVLIFFFSYSHHFLYKNVQRRKTKRKEKKPWDSRTKRCTGPLRKEPTKALGTNPRENFIDVAQVALEITCHEPVLSRPFWLVICNHQGTWERFLLDRWIQANSDQSTSILGI